MNRHLIGLCLLLPLSAIAASPRYQPPSGTELATVKFEGTVPLVAIYENGTNCSEHRRWPKDRFKTAASGGGVDPNSTILKIAAGRPIAFGIHRARAEGVSIRGMEIGQCSLMLSFVPSANKSYAIRFEMDESCNVALNEVSTPEAKDFRPADTALRIRETPGYDGAFCKP